MSSNSNPASVSPAPKEPKHSSFAKIYKEIPSPSNNTQNHLQPPCRILDETDDYSLTHIFTEGLRYCSAYKRENHINMLMNQVLARDAETYDGNVKTNSRVEEHIDQLSQRVVGNNGSVLNINGGTTNSVEPYKTFSSIAGVQSYNRDLTQNEVGFEAETKSDSYAKEWETLLKLVKPFAPKFQKTVQSGKNTLATKDLMEYKCIPTLEDCGSSSSDSRKRKGIWNCSHSNSLSRFAPVNNSNKKMNFTMTERDHAMKGDEKEN